MILCRNIGRRAFITSNGHLGIGPAILEEGDVVVIICGTEVHVTEEMWRWGL
jgi:hypothetical protein